MAKGLRKRWLQEDYRTFIRDRHPDTKDDVIRLLNSWEGAKSEEKLKNMLGSDKAQRILKNINEKKVEQDNRSI